MTQTSALLNLPLPDMPPARPRRQRMQKAPGAYLTIGELAEALNIEQHVLRFWETKFPQIQPLKRAGGRRYYGPADVDLVRRIQTLLYRDGYTIRGVQNLLGGTVDEDDATVTLRISAFQKQFEAVSAAASAMAAPPQTNEGNHTPANSINVPRAAVEQLLMELKQLRKIIES
jgi:DNA-binding transcriptional MerR regulator